MLTRLDLDLFKCFEKLRLPLGNLTLLAGSNASGKSSVMQSLVVLHQTMKHDEWSTRLTLNGDELQLGTVTDVINKVSGRRKFGLGVVDGDRAISWTFEVEDRADMSASVANVTVAGESVKRPANLHFLLPMEPGTTEMGKASADFAKRMRGMSYLTAERLGPRDVYPRVDPNTTAVVGARGENAPSILLSGWGEDDGQILPALRVKGVPPTCLRQVIARMQQFFPGCSLAVQPVPQSNTVTLGIRTSDDTDYHRPGNVGFGLTQVLPIVVAALSARPGGLLLVENPEVHLHPAGQAMMGGFLAEVAAAGVQVILETHSDHVLNGIRRATRKKVIESTNVVIHFFQAGQVVTPHLDDEGNIDVWPDGFFDQFDKDANFFAGWGD